MSNAALLGYILAAALSFLSAILSGLVFAVFRRLGAALALLQSLDTRVSLIEQRMDATDARLAGLDRRIGEVEGDLDVIRLDHARNHGHEYATQQVRPGLIPANARNIR